MIKASVIGASGYSGIGLTAALLSREDVEAAFLTSNTYSGRKVSDVFPFLSASSAAGRRKDVSFSLFNEDSIASSSDVVFFCLPHGESSRIIPGLLRKNPSIKIIDVGADFRFDDAAVYEEYYGPHEAADLNGKFIYGLADIFSEKIKKSQFVANPGCYPTGALLAILPLALTGALDTSFPVIIDSMSGISGAGRGLKLQNLFCEIENSARAYNAWSHRHMPEIKEKIVSAVSAFYSGAGLNTQSLAIDYPEVIFTPHVIPVSRGILTTAYLRLKPDFTLSGANKVFEEFYGGSPFVSMLKSIDECNIKNVAYSNNCHIALQTGPGPKGRIVKLVSAIDNLGKGASLQALQNMNLMFGLDASCGIQSFAPYP